MQLIVDERQALTFTGGLELGGLRGGTSEGLPSEQLGHFQMTQFSD